MHGLSANYNEFLGSNEAAEMGERGAGSIFASPEGRGPDGGYKSYAEADVFEMWADVARHYRLDPALTDISGYSMGGLGTWRLAGRWPDLFARAFPIVGPGTTPAFDASMRNIPVMAWFGQNDELANPATVEAGYAVAQQAGIRYDHWVFAPAGHITIGNNDEFGPAVQFLGDHTVDRDPAHVTYTFDPSLDPKALSASDHAYWLSGLRLGAGKSSGTVDARSRASGAGEAPVEPVKPSAATLNGGSHGPLPYTRRTIEWGAAPRTAKANALDVTTTGLSAVTIDAPRAGVGCDAALNVSSDGPLKVTLGGCDVTRSLRAGRTKVACLSRRSLVLHLPHTVRGRHVRSARVRVGDGKARTVRGPRLALRISLRGRPAGRVRVRITSRLADGRRAVATRTYRVCVKRGH
jgi:pimeloyl-ACP methyl ester carboxylesterase